MTEKLQPKPEGFALTEHEKLWDRISDKRFQELVFDDQTSIHEIKLSSNNYGEFIFLTASRKTAKGQNVLTMWGLGLHQYRERWIQDEWFYYKPYPDSSEKRSL